MFLFSLHVLTDVNQDLGMHLRIGQLMVEHHQISHTNYFSYTNTDFPSVDHRWFFETLLYLSFLAVGLKGLIVLKALVITGALALALIAYDPKITPAATGLAGILAIGILIDRTFVRPEIFSFLFFAWYLFVLFRKPTPRWLWTLPFIQLLWVNSHIYFVLGPAVYLLFLAGKGWRAITKQDLLLVGTILAVNLLNPFGLHGALYPFTVLHNYGIPILENLSPLTVKSFGYPMFPVYMCALALLLTIVSLIINRKNWKNNIFSAGLILLLGFYSFKMVRNMPLFALAMIPISVKNFTEAGWTIKKPWLIGCVVGGILLLVPGLHRPFGLVVPEWGQKAIAFVQQNHISGPVFNNMNTASLLLWNIPDQKVFIDARPEDYPADFIKKVFIPMQNDPALWKTYSEQYGINYVFYAYRELSPWSKTFLYNLTRNPQWQLVYVDDAIAIFVKNTPANAEVIKRNAIHGTYQ